MKKIIVKGWKTILSVESDSESNFLGTKIQENGKLFLELNAIECGCDQKILRSEYIGGENCIFGEASSAFDRALELALTKINEGEEFQISLSVEGKFVSEEFEGGRVVTVECFGSYKIIENGKPTYEYSAPQILSIAKRLKEKAKNVLSGTKSSVPFDVRLSSFYLLERSVKWSSLVNPEEDLENREDVVDLQLLRIQSWNNLAHLYLTFEDFESAIKVSSCVLSKNKNNVKALYRRAVANTHLQNYDSAIEDLQMVLLEEPSNSAAKAQLKIVSNKQLIVDQKYAKAMKKFLSS